MATDTLSFTVRLAATGADLQDACSVRGGSYGHHLGDLGERFAASEPLDHAEGTAVLICRDKATGDAVGTARIQTSAFGPLEMEESLDLPDWLADQPRAEITRLAVVSGADSRVKLSLMKASYLYCLANQMHWMVISARNEALIRNYRRLGFGNVLADDERIPLAHVGNLPHSILSFDVVGAERSWKAASHPLYNFMVDTFHADLQLFKPVALPRTPVRLRAVA